MASSLDTTINAVTRGNTAPASQSSGVENRLQGDVFGNLFVSQGVPPEFEMARQNALFVGSDITTAPSSTAAVIALPTTTACKSLFNGNSIDSKTCLVVTRVNFITSANVAAATAGLMLNLQKLAATVPAQVGTFATMGGSAGYGGLARIATGATAVAADLWYSVGLGSSGGNPIASGFGLTIDSGPLCIIVRPQRQLHQSLVSSATTTYGYVTFTFYEVTIPNLVG